MSGFLQSYLLDVFLSLLIVAGTLILFNFLRKFMHTNLMRKNRMKLTLFLIIVLAVSMLIEIWEDKSEIVRGIIRYKKFFPGYDTVLLIIAAAVFSHFLQLSLLKKVGNVDIDISKRHKARLIAKWGSWGVFFLFVSVIILLQTGWSNIGTFLGLVGAGVALSLQEYALSFLGWLYVVFSRLYDLGDRIQLDGKVGDVISITPTHTRLLEISMKTPTGQSTGRILTVPNSVVIRNSVYNATSGFPFIWLEIEVVITFESDWEKAVELIMGIAEHNLRQIESEVKRNINQMQDDYAIYYQHLSPKVYTSIKENGVKLTLRFLSPVRSCRQREHDVSQCILTEFRKNPEVELAYPTSRIYKRDEELEVPPFS